MSFPSEVAVAGSAGPAADVEAGARSGRRRALRLRETLLSTAAAGALSLALGSSALAGPDACTTAGAVVTCTGNQSDGITNFFGTTLNVNNLTQAIAPADGTNGISFLSPIGTVVSINSNTGAFGITTSDANGIYAFGLAPGRGPVTVTSTGNITAVGSDADGIVASGGAVTVTSTGNIITVGSDAVGILAQGSLAPIAVTINSGTVSGGSGSGAGVELVGGTDNTLTNLGTVTALSGLAIEGDTGNNTVNNFGTVTGNVVLGSGTNAFNNQSGGLFNAGATIDLGAGNALANAGTLSPGGVGTIQTTALTGNLTQSATGLLLADINVAGATSDRINVSGTAALGGTVRVQLQNPVLGPWQQTVLSAAGGTTNNGLSLLASPALHAELIDPNATDVAVRSSGINFLISGLNGNQSSVAAGLNGAAQKAGLGGPVFNALLTGFTSPGGYGNALTQLSGEAATGAQGASFQLTNSFLALLTEPAGPTRPFAPERADVFPSDVAPAYASVLKAPVVYKSRWTTWGAVFGGSSTTNGDPAGAGTNSVSAQTGAFAVGIDEHVAPDTVVGVALAGGRVNWALGGGLGGGGGDTFMAGLYGSKQSGPAYVGGALTFSSNWMRTSRSISVAGSDTLTAAFNARNFGGRLEGGYRLPAAVAFNITPYAAVQAQTFHSPAYRENGMLGAPDPFALMFNAQSATVVRTELGSRFDQMFAQAGAGTIDLFGRVAWAHGWQSNPDLAASFIGLPAATFVVNGAAPPSNLALLTAGAEWRWRTGWSVMAKLDGEFASSLKTYAGTVSLKHTW